MGQNNGYIDNYYTRGISDERIRPALIRDIAVETCVIGGGLAGLNTALGLLERGKQAMVIEARRMGWGGSGRNGGFVAKGYAAGEGELLKRLGLEKAQQLVGMTKAARQLIKSRIADYNIDCGPLKPGVLTVSWRDDPQALKDGIRRANDNFDLGFEFWPREKVREHCRTEKYYDGVFSPHDFQFMPLKYVFGLARAIEQRGGVIYEETPAIRIEKDGAAWVVHTPGGRVRAQHVVLCCSIYIDGLDKRLARAAFPVRTFVTATKPVDAALLAQSINTPYAIYDNRFCSDYYRVLPDNRILWGGRVALWANPRDIAPLLMHDMFKVYPQLAGKVEAEVSWQGELCYAPHKMPQIGMIEPGYWYNTGFGGHGLAPTTVGGEAVAAAIAGDSTMTEAFAPFGLSYAGGKLGRYAAQMVYWWWRARDVLNI